VTPAFIVLFIIAATVFWQRRRPTAVLNALFGLLILSLAFLIGLNHYYQITRSPVADSQAGRIYPLNDHGKIVYLTKTEDAWIFAAEALFFGTWLCAAGFGLGNWAVKKLNNASVADSRQGPSGG
jgi:hypothetical protein